MSLDLRKAPWPEWDAHFKEPACPQTEPEVCLTRSEYAFARHRVNLHEEAMVALAECREALSEYIHGDELNPAHLNSALESVQIVLRLNEESRQLLARAKEGQET
jgi:hypothetical protein